ncbi:MAG: DUF4743 domain-containing protein [Acetobacteraceae bacterium]|nr:DUF4743 domain-containing protein [Acetobacteraceae bacterium]
MNSDRLRRHIEACNNARLPGGRVRFRLDGAPVGWVRPDLADELAAIPEVSLEAGEVVLHAPELLPRIAEQALRHRRLRIRGELFDVRADSGGPSLAVIDRAGLPLFGILAEGVHLNGLVRRQDGLYLWVARRAEHKSLDPGKFDHIVAGGVPAGLTCFETLVKEAAEEAAIPSELVRQAVPVGQICYAMERAEGLRRDWLYCYDLELPEDFRPRAVDGEVAAFELWPLPRVLERVRDTDDFKFNVNLVLVDLFRRKGLIGEYEAVVPCLEGQP